MTLRGWRVGDQQKGAGIFSGTTKRRKAKKSQVLGSRAAEEMGMEGAVGWERGEGVTEHTESR